MTPSTQTMRTEPLQKRARPPFHWQQVDYSGGRDHQTQYLVWSNQQRQEQRYCLGAIVRVRGGFRAYPRGKNNFHSRPIPGVYATREKASIALVIYLNNFQYGRDRLDAANIRHWRTPR